MSDRPPNALDAERLAGLSAVAAVLLFAVANALWAFDQPAPDASGPQLVAFYSDASQRIVAGALASLASIALFAVFASALREVLAWREHGHVLADVAFGGTLLGLAAGVGAESINMAAAIRAGDDALTESLALALFDISYVLGSYAAAVGFGLLALAVGVAALRSRSLLPRWLAIAGLAVGIASVTPLLGYVIGEYAVGPSFLIVLALGVRLLAGSRSRRRPEAGGA